MSRNREAYALKVAALSIALAASIIIALFSLNEFGYDRFHHHADQVFRVVEKNLAENYGGNRTTSKIDPEFINTLTNQHRHSLVVSRMKIMERVTMDAAGQVVSDHKIHAVDTTIDKIFSLDIIAGSIDAFKHQNDVSIMVSSSFAEEHWKTTDIANKKVKLYTFGDTLHAFIAAVFRSFPKNSHEQFDVFISFDRDAIDRLNFNPLQTGVYGRSVGEKPERITFPDQGTKRYILQPITQIYFGPRIVGEAARHGDRYSIIILVCITSMIFFLAITTFINLTTITLPYRAKELAVKKLAGVKREHLIAGFLVESGSLVGLSLLIGLVILLLAAPMAGTLLGFDVMEKIIHLDYKFVIIISILFSVLTVAPVFLTLRFVDATPNRLLSTDTITFPALKRYITFVQLGISIFLIMASVVIKRQINYSLLKEPGQNQDQIVYINSPTGITNEGVDLLRTEWRRSNPNILDVMAVSQLPDRISSKERHSNFYQLYVDRGFRDFFDLTMLEGKWFGPNPGDSTVIINNTAKRSGVPIREQVLGVIEDTNDLFNQPQKPTKIKRGNDYGYNWLCVRVLEVDIRRTVQRLTNAFSTPDEHADVRYFDDQFSTWIAYQDRLNMLSDILTMIAALLSCCTIYALSMSVVRDKLKQIALHQLFGASTLNIAVLVMTDFFRQLGIALLVFLPLSYIALNELLRTFIYSTHFHWLDPVYPLAYCMLVIVTISLFQAWNLRRTNSVAALKG